LFTTIILYFSFAIIMCVRLSCTGHGYGEEMNSMVQGSHLEAQSHLAGQETHCPLWNMMIHSCVHNSPLLHPALS